MTEKSETTSEGFSKIIVAVHGIGDQMRNETIRSVATRMARIRRLAGNEALIAPQPLGYFFRTSVQPITISRIAPDLGSASQLSNIGFCEAYWADIPNRALDDKHTVEETKAWARTVVSRARAVFHRNNKNDQPDTRSFIKRLQTREPDFGLAAEVLDEMIDAIRVLQNLCFLADKAGVVKFDLRSILEKYVDDVQVVTEYTLYRRDIIGRFHSVMEQIHHDHKGARLHIVAHSEGTVVSFLGLLHAMCGERLTPVENSDKNPPQKPVDPREWLEQVDGYMTIGSPIDKHLLLWRGLFEPFEKKLEAAEKKSGKIKWRNYYDYGDPVGFKLNTAHEWLVGTGCKVFDFDSKEDKDDFGFSRYLWPGKAHTDYWNDPAVFEHFIYDVVIPPKDPSEKPKKPETRRITRFFSVFIPYAASFLVLFAGTALFYRTALHFLKPQPDTVQAYVRLMTVGDFPSGDPNSLESIWRAVGLTLLIAGTTLCVRWPRIVKGTKWYLAAASAFALGWAGCLFFVRPAALREIGSILFVRHELVNIVLLSVLVVLIGFLPLFKPELDQDGNKKEGGRIRKLSHKLLNTRATRRMRWFSRQMRPLIFTGAAIIALIIGLHLKWPQPVLTEDQQSQINFQFLNWETNQLHIAQKPVSAFPPGAKDELKSALPEGATRGQSVENLLEVHRSAWPSVLTGLAFLYLWWLSALLFDLTFVWHWYIRHSKLNEKLRDWQKDSLPQKKPVLAPPPTTVALTP